MSRKKIDPYTFSDAPSESLIQSEKQKARNLRNTEWWKRKCAKGICYYCGEKTEPIDITMDHVVPLSRGGKSTKGNVVPACKSCNTKKKLLLPMEWVEYMDRIKKQD